MSSSPEILSDCFPSPTLSDMTATTIPPSPPDAIDFDAEHYWDFVEGRLFQVPKYRFVEDSDHFSTLFDLESKLGQEYGLDDPHLDAVKLENVSVGDFQTFLKVLYPRDLEALPSFNQEQWMSVLVLATKWRFGDLRKRTMKEVKDLPNLSEKIRLAEALTIPVGLTGAYMDLILRDIPIGLAGAEQLGMEKTLLLHGIREKYLRSQRRNCIAMRPDEIMQEIERVFSGELEVMRKKEMEMYPTKEQKRKMLDAKVKEAEEAKKLAEKEAEAAKRLAETQAVLKEEEERKRLAKELEEALEEQRQKLAILEQEKARVMGGKDSESPTPDGLQAPVSAKGKKKKSSAF